jgi:hypothetical protein
MGMLLNTSRVLMLIPSARKDVAVAPQKGLTAPLSTSVCTKRLGLPRTSCGL